MSKIFQTRKKVHNVENCSKKPVKSDRIQSCGINNKVFLVGSVHIDNFIPRSTPEIWMNDVKLLSDSGQKTHLIEPYTQIWLNLNYLLTTANEINHTINGLTTRDTPNFSLRFTIIHLFPQRRLNWNWTSHTDCTLISRTYKSCFKFKRVILFDELYILCVNSFTIKSNKKFLERHLKT